MLVQPAGNRSFADAADRYRRALADPRTFQVLTLERLLGDASELPAGLIGSLRERDLW